MKSEIYDGRGHGAQMHASHGGWCGKQRGRKSEIGGELCVINRGNVIFIVLPFYMRNFKSVDISIHSSIHSMFVFRLHNYIVWFREIATPKNMMDLIEKKEMRLEFECMINAPATNDIGINCPESSATCSGRQHRKTPTARVCVREKFKGNFVT